MKNNSGLLNFHESNCYNEQHSLDGTSCRFHCGTTLPPEGRFFPCRAQAGRRDAGLSRCLPSS
jgi:hypothetical protein